MTDAAALYLDLLKRSLTGMLTRDPATAVFGIDDDGFLRPVEGAEGSYDEAVRREGLDWPATAPTMVGLRRLDHLQESVETLLREGVEGDFLEAGVWRGGCGIFLRALLALHGDGERRIWLADAFGSPPYRSEGNEWDSPRDIGWMANLSQGVDEVRRHFRDYGLLDDRVLFLRGWFRDTLPRAPVRRLALLRLDGDLYESTRDALVHLYPRLSPGGYVVVDDYQALRACRQAVTDYRQEHGIRAPITPIDQVAVFWRRGPEETP